jgi:glycosyltransferase involved in cell wall biosynthesis
MSAPSDKAHSGPRILHTIDTGGPGGAETIFAACASHVPPGGQNPLAVIPYDGWLAGHLRSLGIEPIFLPSRGAANIPYFAGLTRLAQRHRTQIIHSHLLGANVYSAAVGWLLGVPVIAVFHGATDLANGGGRFAALKRALLQRRHVQVVAVSNGVRDDLIRWGLNGDDVITIYNGIDTERFSPGHDTSLRLELGMSDGDLLVGAIGNVRAPKGYDVLLRAAARIAHKRRVRFVIVGDSPPEALAPLLKLRADLELDKRVDFLGFRAISPALLQNFDVFLSSSRSEGLPLSFLEAMAVGLPVVATPTTGAAEVLTHARTGIVASANDPESLADALVYALDNADVRARLGAAARTDVVQRYSRHTMLSAYDALYRRVTTEDRPA